MKVRKKSFPKTTMETVSRMADFSSHLHSHGLSGAFYFDPGFVHRTKVHQHWLVVLLQQHISGLQVSDHHIQLGIAN